MKKINGYIIAIVFLVITIIGLGSYIIIDKIQENKKEETKIETKEETAKDEIIKLQTLKNHIIHTDNNIKITKTEDEKIIINTDDFKNKEIGTNISYAEIFSFSQSDVCYGDSWLIMIDKNNKVTASSIDSIVCSNEIKTKNITKELQKLGVNEIKGIYQNNKYYNEYEPLAPRVYMVTDNNKIIEITSILE